MIRQVEYFYGAAIARLCRESPPTGLSIRMYGEGRSAYVIEEEVGLYIKYSTNRMSPWTFSFQVEHQDEIATLRSEFTDVFVALICGFDGIACLTGAEYQRVLDDDPKPGEWIKAARMPREKYSITGSDDRTVHKIGDNEFPAKLFNALSK